MDKQAWDQQKAEKAHQRLIDRAVRVRRAAGAELAGRAGETVENREARRKNGAPRRRSKPAYLIPPPWKHQKPE